MSLDSTFRLALALLSAAALVVGVCGWVLVARDRRPAKSTEHHGVTEGN
jgi:hypothetical protein